MLCVALTIGGCAAGEQAESVQNEPPLYDLAPADEVKADGHIFDSSLLISDDVFVDWGYLSEDEIQAFLEDTPYGTRSFLADYREGYITVARQIAQVAKTYRINPMILLVKLQVETSMIFKTQTPTRHTLDRAMGCGCPDGQLGCHASDAGLYRQLECGGRLLRSYLQEIDAIGTTVTGWGPNKTKVTSDGLSITPRSAATAALYTYTPWVLQGRGGNWLLWNVHRKYSIKVQRDRPNYRWIGGPCAQDTDCGFADAVCLAGDRGALGVCTVPCERVCPDSGALFTSTTFCIGADGLRRAQADALCVAQCNESLFPHNAGCRDDHVCQRIARYGEAETIRAVCVPSDHDFPRLENETEADADSSGSDEGETDSEDEDADRGHHRR